jgi:heme exporter protein D
MDRYYSHTQSCRSCSTALRRIRAARPWAWVVLWGAAALVGLGQGGVWSAVGVVVAALAGLTLRQVSRWEKGLIRGDGAAPRNRQGLIKATAKATGWVSLSLQHFLQPLLSLPR